MLAESSFSIDQKIREFCDGASVSRSLEQVYDDS